MINNHCRTIDVSAVDEDVIIGLFKNEDDKDRVAWIDLDIETAEAVYEMLGQEITKAKEAKRKLHL